jgi:hypothetical protein
MIGEVLPMNLIQLAEKQANELSEQPEWRAQMAAGRAEPQTKIAGVLVALAWAYL